MHGLQPEAADGSFKCAGATLQGKATRQEIKAAKERVTPKYGGKNTVTWTNQGSMKSRGQAIMPAASGNVKLKH